MNVDCYRRDVEGLWVFSPTVRGTVWSWLVSIFSVQSLLCMRMFLDRVKSLTLLDLKVRGFLAQPVGLLADVTTNE